ncbi:MAG: hypothetical protein CM15mP87_01500 [Candidatus Neomarinimicrobiota bacterium]|nr:MAG: hypothetical protein CM15mP87_01500 [Candidatus Neomarinimicrobiota bacterium]
MFSAKTPSVPPALPPHRTFTGARRGDCFGGPEASDWLFEFMKFCLTTTNKFSLRHRIRTGFRDNRFTASTSSRRAVENQSPPLQILSRLRGGRQPQDTSPSEPKADDIGARFALPPSFTEMMRTTGAPKYQNRRLAGNMGIFYHQSSCLLQIRPSDDLRSEDTVEPKLAKSAQIAIAKLSWRHFPINLARPAPALYILG